MEAAVHPIDQDGPAAHHHVDEFAGTHVTLALAADHPAKPV